MLKRLITANLIGLTTDAGKLAPHDFCCRSLQSLVIRDADFITLGKLDASPGLTVFLGNFLDDMQLFIQRFYSEAASIGL
jgi:hypothetical protein